ncbi:integrase catalytic domain-containing protein [Trichonephila clavipes]|nr:integrase catalytic domain-containing protein [Trichonephila clavipes]
MDAANKAILERTKKTRSVSRSLVTKQINKLESEISNTADKTTVHEIYMQLISKFEELSTLDKEIEILIDIESLEEEIVTREEYRDKFIIWKIRAERYVESVSNTAIQNSVENQPQNITLPLNSTVSSILTNQPRLPKLTLESFSGKDISSFSSFWARFNSAVHENSSLNDVNKFSYLKSVVTSDAELAIRGLTLTSENYAKAMKILENRFGRKELIFDFHMNRLLNLTPVRKSFDVIALRNLYYQLEINIRGLESLEISPDSYSCLLFPIIMKAIPPDLALEYNKKHNETQSQITDLIAYLRSEVESRERTEFLVKLHDLELKNKNSYSNTKYFERTSHSYPQSNRRVQGHSRFHPSHKSFSSANELLTDAFSNCLFCSQNTHMSDLCNGDEEILSEFDKSVNFVDGRYRVNLPWQPGMREALQNNKTVARKRFEGLVRRFKCDHELFCEYKDVIDDYVREGIVERTSCDSLLDSQGFYLPHHAVIRSDKTTSRIRIVFDGSAHEDGQSSLNQTDVKSAFLQIELDFRDRDFTRFFWTDNLNNEPYVLNFTRVLFGLRPSPYLLAATLKHHFKKYREQYPHTFELLNSSIYVDDLICGQNDVPDVLRTTLECLKIFSDAGMLLRKWRSNSKQLNLLWQQEGVKTESSETSAIDLRPPTKELWTLGVEWDSELPPKLRHKWQQWSSEAEGLTEIKIPRFYLGKDNPADLLSRGTSAVKLAQNELWWHGPPWLKLTPDHWPNRHRDILDSELCSEELEHRSSVHVAVTQQREALVDINRFSSLKKLLKTTAWVFRFVNNARNIYKSMDFYITADEIQTEYFWLKCVPSEFYSAEILALKQNEQLRSSSEIKSLVPYLDENNLLRLTGWLLEEDLCFGEKHPVILPRRCKFTELLVIREHERIGHCGVSATLTQLRKKYWIPKGRQLVKTMIRICLVCKKYSAKQADQLSGELPRDRITQSPPFQIVGIDFTGAILVKDNQGTRKSYFSLFTCAVTRAVHLELVSDMSTRCFLLALRRFLASRGNCKVIYSDNARTFKAAERELAYFANILKDSEFQSFVADKGIHWKFIVEHVPWWGGFYERLVKTIKDPLRKILGRALLTFEELLTILSEVEVIVNHRPLTYVENDPEEPEPLTPAHFLELGYGDSKYPIHFIELIDATTAKESYKKRKTYRTLLLKQLWRRWKEQYLLQLKPANHFKTPTVRKNLKLNDVVLVEENVKSKLF